MSDQSNKIITWGKRKKKKKIESHIAFGIKSKAIN